MEEINHKCCRELGNKVIEKIVSIDNIEKVWGCFNHSDFWASKDHIYENGLVDLVSEKWIVTEECEKFIQDEKLQKNVVWLASEESYFEEVYKDEEIYAGNLCNEICLPSNHDESFVCCLASMNLLHYDEWKGTNAVKILTYFLDAVMEEFIEESSGMELMERSTEFARNHRALGLGVLGWHSYLQNNNIAFESFDATMKNAEIFRHLKQQTNEASKELFDLFGGPDKYPDLGRRNTTLMAIAPTKSSSYILGQVSPSIEPYKSNYYIKDLAKAKEVFRNPYLKVLLESKGQDNNDTWDSILNKDGSVQHLDFLSDHEKNVFKTFSELSQMAVIKQAAQRQAFIDQGQSLNLKIPSEMTPKQINEIHINAWESGVKGLYYQRGTSVAKEKVLEMMNCKACEV